MRKALLLGLLLCGSVSALTRAEVERWPVLYEPIHDGQPPQTLAPSEAALLRQIVGDANHRPALRKYRASLPQWAQKNLTLSDLVLSRVAPYRSPQAERLSIFHFPENWDARLVVLSSAGQSAAWLLTEGEGCGPWEKFFPYDIDEDGQMELAWAHGCADSSSVLQTFSLLDWQRGELKLTHETVTDETANGFRQERTVIHVKKGPKPQLVGISTHTETAYTDESQPLPHLDKTKVTLRPLLTPLPQPSFKLTRLW